MPLARSTLSSALRVRRYSLLSSASVLLVASHAWAAPPVTETADTIALSEITVAPEAPAATTSGTPNASAGYVGGVTGIGGALRPVDAASAGIITGAQINSRPVTRPGEVLEEVPGLIITQHSGEGKANQYFLRGFNLDHGTDIAINVDGMPVNMRTHAHGQGYADLNFLIPELVGAVEFHKGPYFVRDGDFASAGSVRIDYLDKLNRSIALTTLGSFGLKRALSAASAPLGVGNLLVAGEAQTYDGPWVVPDTLRKFNGVVRYSQGTPTTALRSPAWPTGPSGMPPIRFPSGRWRRGSSAATAPSTRAMAAIPAASRCRGAGASRMPVASPGRRPT